MNHTTRFPHPNPDRMDQAPLPVENLQTLRLGKMQELTRYAARPDAKPYVVRKLRAQLEALRQCVDLTESGVDNQLLLLLRDTLYKALHVDGRDDVLIVGMRLTDSPVIRSVALADIVYNPAIGDPQQGLYELLQIQPDELARYNFRHILEGLDRFKM